VDHNTLFKAFSQSQAYAGAWSVSGCNHRDPAYIEQRVDATETAAITHAVRYQMPVLSCSLG
jgi:hypothetical protein